MQRDRGHLEGCVLRLARPLELRVPVRIVGIGALCARVGIGVGRDQPDGRVVHPLLVPMLVGFNRPFGLGFSSCN